MSATIASVYSIRGITESTVRAMFGLAFYAFLHVGEMTTQTAKVGGGGGGGGGSQFFFSCQLMLHLYQMKHMQVNHSGPATSF